MKTYRSIVIAISTLSTLIIIAGGLWAWRVHQQVQSSIQTRSFLQPTEYYSYPAIFQADISTYQNVIEALQKRSYQEKTINRHLLEGEYFVADEQPCSEQMTFTREFAKCVVYQVRFSKDLPNSNLQALAFDEQGRVVEAIPENGTFLEGQLVAQYVGAHPIWQSYTELGKIPTSCLNAVLAIEDVHFLEHSGISVLGILRAMLVNLLKGRIAQGGSTITQQMVKNYFLTSERSLRRKLTELVMSISLESQSSKDQILETYLNIIYMGQNGPFQIIGFPAAARHFFSKEITQLNLAECSLLAAVLNSPKRFDPFTQPENAQQRRQLVLKKMWDHQFITEQEFESSTQAKLPENRQFEIYATTPFYIDAVNKELTLKSVEYEGKKIFTGLIESAQESAQRAVQSQLEEIEKNKKSNSTPLEGLLIGVDNQTGMINALVGGRNFKLTQFNRAVDAHRQVGSIMKPFVYLAAIQNPQKYNPLTIINDEKFSVPVNKKSWSPENYDKQYRGAVPLYVGLSQSLNAATASLGMSVGLDEIINLVREFSIHSSLESYPSMTLGAFELYPLEVVQAYTTLARFGRSIPVSTVRQVRDRNDDVIYQRSDEESQILTESSIAVLVGMMKQTFLSGTAQWVFNAGFHAPAAGKTGTTSDYKDSWFAGFTPSHTAVAWIGNDQATPTGLTGSTGGLKIWWQYMKSLSNREESDFSWPDGVEKRTVDDVELIFEKSL